MDKNENKNVANNEAPDDSVVNPIISGNINVTEDEMKSENKKNVGAEIINSHEPEIKNHEKSNVFNALQEDIKEATEEKMVTIPELPEIRLKESHKKFFIISSIVIVILFSILLLSTIFGLAVQNNNKIIKGVNIKNISVSNYTREEALDKINSLIEQKLSNPITLKHNDYTFEIYLNQLDVSSDLNKAVIEAFNKGRSNNIFVSNFETILLFFTSTNIDFNFTYNEDTLDSFIKEMENNLPDKFIDNSYYIDGNDLVISRGHEGYIIDSDSLKIELSKILNDLNNNVSELDIPVKFKELDNIDINKIHNEVYKEPQNAYYTTNPYVVYPHVDGIDFDISIEEAQNLINENSEGDIVIPLIVITPDITTNRIGTEAFPDELGSFYTTYSTSNVNRSTNIRLASEKIDGTVVMPGEVFSYNTTVGQRTTAAGFKAAAVYSGGEVTTGIGGGICQVSSTLYNAVLYANLEIVERSNHGFNPGYVAVSRDATVSWGGPDFKFRNTRDYPIKIVCSGSGGIITVQIFGLSNPDDPEIEIQSYVTRWISYSTVTKEDPTLPRGETKVVQNGSNGCKSVAYRVFYKDGEEIDRELLSQDTYSPHNKIIAVGT